MNLRLSRGPRAGALKTLGANKDAPLPVRLFEASDVILLDERSESGARNERRLAAVVCSKESGFEIIHGLLNRIMEVLDVPILGNGPTELPHSISRQRRGLSQPWLSIGAKAES